MRHSYAQLQKDIEIGHEFEFFYNKHKYSFSNNQEGWYITKYDDPDNYQSFKDQFELLEKGTIEGLPIKKIWGKIKELIVF